VGPHVLVNIGDRQVDYTLVATKIVKSAATITVRIERRGEGKRAAYLVSVSASQTSSMSKSDAQTLFETPAALNPAVLPVRLRPELALEPATRSTQVERGVTSSASTT
jgi:hypothetical protein